MSYTAKQKAKALETLDGLEKIIEFEALQHVGYLGDCDVKRKKALPICKGHNACMIGSLYLAHGVRRQRDYNGDWELPGIYDQAKFVARRPALKLAYDAMNEAAGRLIKRHPDWDVEGANEGYEGTAERLFEAIPTNEGFVVYDENYDIDWSKSNPIAAGDKAARKRLVDSARKIVEKA